MGRPTKAQAMLELLVVYASQPYPASPFPFSIASFCDRTGLTRSPFATVATPSDHDLNWTPTTIQQVLDVVHLYHSSSTSKTGRLNFKLDGLPGRNFINKLASNIVAPDHLDALDAWLEKHADGYDVLIQIHGAIPAQPTAWNVIAKLGEYYFGDEYESDAPTDTWLDDVRFRLLERYKWRMDKFGAAIQKKATKNAADFKLLAHPAKAEDFTFVQKWAKSTQKLIHELRTSTLPKHVELRDTLTTHLRDYARAVGVTVGDDKASSLPRQMLDILGRMGSLAEFAERHKLHAKELLDLIDNEDYVENDPRGADGVLDSETVAQAMPTSTDALQAKTTDQLQAYLGFPGGRIPGMVSHYDPTGKVHGWMKDPADRDQFRRGTLDKWGLQVRLMGALLLPFLVPHHQWVGVARAIELLMEGMPVLLFDEVGLGKTIEVLLIIAVVKYFAESKSTGPNFCFPGGFKGRHVKNGEGCTTVNSTCPIQHRDDDGNFPLASPLIVCPPSLIGQWTDQIHRFMVNSEWTLAPFIGASPRIRAFVVRDLIQTSNSVVNRTGQRSRIVLASTSALGADFHENLNQRRYTTYDVFPPVASLTSVFRLRFSLIFVDEIHGQRKPGSLQFNTARAVAALGPHRILVTATPVITEISDVSNIACIGWHPEFCTKAGQDKADATMRLIRSARRRQLQQARKHAQEHGGQKAADLLATMISSEKLGVANDSTTAIIAKAAIELGKALRNCVIRRTIESVDRDGKPIIDLPVETVVNVCLELLPHEEKIFQELLRRSDAVDGSGNVKTMTQKLAEAFYLRGRLFTMHYLALDKAKLKTFPVSSLEYDDNQSTKCNGVLHILDHHQDRQAPPTNFLKGEWHNVDFNMSPQPATPRNPDLPQKFVIYMFFAQTVPMLERIIRHHGYVVRSVTGSMSARARAVTIREWELSPNSEILIITSVGATGVNLQVADILILVDPSWSAQIDRQARGRIQRTGQTSATTVYRLIVKGTADEVLLKIADDKGTALIAFTGEQGEVLYSTLSGAAANPKWTQSELQAELEQWLKRTDTGAALRGGREGDNSVDIREMLDPEVHIAMDSDLLAAGRARMAPLAPTTEPLPWELLPPLLNPSPVMSHSRRAVQEQSAGRLPSLTVQGYASSHGVFAFSGPADVAMAQPRLLPRVEDPVKPSADTSPKTDDIQDGGDQVKDVLMDDNVADGVGPVKDVMMENDVNMDDWDDGFQMPPMEVEDGFQSDFAAFAGFGTESSPPGAAASLEDREVAAPPKKLRTYGRASAAANPTTASTSERASGRRATGTVRSETTRSVKGGSKGRMGAKIIGVGSDDDDEQAPLPPVALNAPRPRRERPLADSTAMPMSRVTGKRVQY